MPSDIRSFFGGKPAQPAASPTKPATTTKARGRKSRVVMDDEDSEDNKRTKKSTPKKVTTTKPKVEEEPKGKSTSTSDYFGSGKPKRSEATKARSTNTTANSKGASVTPKKSSNSRSKQDGSDAVPDRTRTPRSAKQQASLNRDDVDNDDDIFSANYKKSGRVNGDDYESGTDDEDFDDPVPVKGTRRAASKAKSLKVKDEDDYAPQKSKAGREHDEEDDDDDEDDSEEESDNVMQKPAPKNSRKRKSEDLEDDIPTPKKKTAKKATPAKASTTKKTAKQSEIPENSDMVALLDSIPMIRAPTPPERDEDKKFNFSKRAPQAALPPAAGSKEIPTGAENCLAGMTFVFTGVNATLSREEGQELVKRYGGKAVGAPSKSTSFVVLGSDAGPKKLETIRQYGLKTIDEDGLFALIQKMPANGGSGKAAEAYAMKQRKDEEKIRVLAEEMAEADRKASAAPAKSKAAGTAAATQSTGPVVESRLWTVKYAPTQLSHICGNKGQVEKLQNWLRAFPRSLKTNFKLAGKDASGTYRAIIISGPPGIGKTTAAHLVAKEQGYDIVEMNASDTRSKKLMEQSLKGVLGTTSLLGYFAGDGKEVQATKKKLCLIMDEVDGMSAGDRGGVGAMAAVCKTTHIPIILICNERKLPKMRPFDFVTFDLPFRKPTNDMIRSRMTTIAFREKIKIPPNVMDALIQGSGADIRQVVNMLSTVKLDQEAIDFDTGKAMSKQWEKHVVLKPWDIMGKILGGGMFAASSKATLNDKAELYFNDHAITPLMLAENYLAPHPAACNNYSGKERSLKHLELISNAADAISDGDLVDRMIHGSQQQWSLMPTHAMFSFVRPAYYVAGNLSGGGQLAFPSWLGRNSTQGKMMRLVKEIQGHMRLRSSGDRHEVRQQYMPVLWQKLVARLQNEGKGAVPQMIDLMDSYFLTKDDFDAILELGVGPMEAKRVQIDSQAKSTFTRVYNQQSHPLPFMKPTNVIPLKKAAKEKPDLEEAIEESDDGEVVDDAPDKVDDEADIAKDKYIKAPKKKAPAKAAAKGKKRAAAAANDDGGDDDDDADSQPPPAKKGRGAAGAAKGKGKARK